MVKSSATAWLQSLVRELRSYSKLLTVEGPKISGNNGNSERLYFLGSKITADGDCSHEIKRRLLLGRKAMTKLDSMFKSRDITLPTKAHLVKAMEKAMAPHSSTLAWKIPRTGEPGRLQSMGSLRVGHD